MPAYEDGIECSETSPYKIQTPGNYLDIHAPQVGFEPTISAGERPQTYALDRAATGAGARKMCNIKFTKETNFTPHNLTI